jgi:multiple sugar transport system permease protein
MMAHVRRGRGMKSRRIAVTAVQYLLCLLGALIVSIPLYWVIDASLQTNQAVGSAPQFLPDHPVWSNYSDALTYVDFGTFFKNTMILEFFIIVGVLLSSSMAAYSFARLRWPGRDVWFLILLSVLMVPYFSTLVPTFLLWHNLNLVNTFYPLIAPAFFGNSFFIFLLRQFFRGIPKELEDAARIDGAGFFRVFLVIILPLARPALAVVAIFTFTNVWNDFLNPLIYLNSNDKFTLALGLQMFLQEQSAPWAELMAACTMVIIPMVAVIQGITLGGLKG